MKTLGLIGGTTWHSTIEYYRAINQGVHARLGGAASARLILYSVNFQELRPTDDESLAHVVAELTRIARSLEVAGAECIALCANTPHIAADQVQGAISIPLLHIAEPIGDAIEASGQNTVGLLGTRPTMERPFLKAKLEARGITTVIPDEESRAFIHSSILEELGQGIFDARTKARYIAIMEQLGKHGAQGIILGCTEIPLLVSPSESPLPVYDTLALHAAAIVEFALSE